MSLSTVVSAPDSFDIPNSPSTLSAAPVPSSAPSFSANAAIVSTFFPWHPLRQSPAASTAARTPQRNRRHLRLVQNCPSAAPSGRSPLIPINPIDLLCIHTWLFIDHQRLFHRHPRFPTAHRLQQHLVLLAVGIRILQLHPFRIELIFRQGDDQLCQPKRAMHQIKASARCKQPSRLRCDILKGT